MTQESPVWVTGALVSAFSFALAVAGMFAFGESLIQINVIFGLVVLVVIIGCGTPTMWRYRARPVLRWVLYGVAGGVSAACVGILAMLIFAP